MTPKTYRKVALKTECSYPVKTREARLLHAALGLSEEVGEFVKQIKRSSLYRRPLDEANLVEELGDILWFVNLALDALDVSIEECMQRNADKLKARHGEAFQVAHYEKRNDK